jgi:ketosteroid isomerase-like protein
MRWAMYLNDLPKPIRAFLDATQNRDSTALLSAFTDDAVLVDMGVTTGDAPPFASGSRARSSATT